MKDDICCDGYNESVGAFTQAYGSEALDASLLLLPLVGFLPVTDERVRSTIEAICSRLMRDGVVMRCEASDEGAFLPCSLAG